MGKYGVNSIVLGGTSMLRDKDVILCRVKHMTGFYMQHSLTQFYEKKGILYLLMCLYPHVLYYLENFTLCKILHLVQWIVKKLKHCIHIAILSSNTSQEVSFVLQSWNLIRLETKTVMFSFDKSKIFNFDKQIW